MLYIPEGSTATADNAKDRRPLAYGSAFLYELDGKTYLVTARHNLTGRHWQTTACLGAYPVGPTHIRFMILAKPPTGGGWPIKPTDDDPTVGQVQILLKAFMKPVLGDDWKPQWREHPHFGPKMDVAVLEFDLQRDELQLSAWKSPAAPRGPEQPIFPAPAAGQDVFVVGYPDALTSGPGFPLWIRGSIASEPAFGFPVNDITLPLMLVDARTRRGQSGSVVMRHIPEGTLAKNADGTTGITNGPVSQIVGVYSGRTSDESDLGYVWRIEAVDAICRNGVPGTDSAAPW
ncbi:hypothetical protein MMUC44124_00960 [Mycolicibacterium mucogenicum DSM 44124]|nr:hypothetical protein MMUC44124_00960 [Mycolicibacterium mucogenicum DSM 44124]